MIPCTVLPCCAVVAYRRAFWQHPGMPQPCGSLEQLGPIANLFLAEIGEHGPGGDPSPLCPALFWLHLLLL